MAEGVNYKMSPPKLYCIFICLVVHVRLSGCLFISKVTTSECTRGEDRKFYDISHLQCLDCSPNAMVNSDGLSCSCGTGYRTTAYYGGPTVTCEACTNGICPSATAAPPCPGVESGGVCFESSCALIAQTPDLFTIPLQNCQSEKVESDYLREHLRAVHAMCLCYENYTACQSLGNMCTLLMFSTGGLCVAEKTACTLYRAITKNVEWPPSMPMLYYVERADDIIYDDTLSPQFTFDSASANSKLRFRVAKYALDGSFLGLTDVLGGVMQLCAGTDKQLDAAYTFGTYYTQNCEITASQLWDTRKYQLTFLDPYLEYEENGESRLFAIPIAVSNYVDEKKGKVNEEARVNDWQLTRRMFIIDNVGTVPPQTSSSVDQGTPAGEDEGKAQYVVYARSIRISISLRFETEGLITPPTINITYGQVSLSEANNGAKVPVSFSIEYSMTETEHLRNFQIAVGTLSTLGILYAAYRTWAWSKRAGRVAIDFLTLINFIFYVAGSLANVFFVVLFGIAFYYCIFFKRQDAVFLVHPSGEIWTNFQGLLGSAFLLKLLHIVHLVFMQCTADVFLIDWERPRGSSKPVGGEKKKGQENPVSIWRTYFIANEWNELQGIRKINHIFQIFVVLLFLEVIGFVNVSTKDPSGSVDAPADEYHAEQSAIYRFSTTCLVYLLVGLVQWIFFTIIYERFLEDKVRQFVDLCSMSNISVFIMAHAQYGFYIHGRSVHGKADTDMRDMHEMMKREEEDLCGQRGLLPNTDQQTFEMIIPPRLRYKYNQVYLPLALEKDAQTPAGRAERGQTGSRIAGTIVEKQIQAYSTINKFLSAFIDHSLRDLDYVVKDKTLLEGILDTEFLNPTEKGILYNDNGHGFSQVLFYGHEFTLLMFDLLFFCVVDLLATNYLLAAIMTYVMAEIVILIRCGGGRSNLAKKTLVDERFLI